MGKITLLAILLFILLMPAAFSITLQDLISFFSFDFFTAAINATNQTDFMIDKDGDNINDTLIIELTTNGNAGNYLVVADLYDDSIITNETNKSLAPGINKFNISFPTEFLTKNKFNYTIKIYDDRYSLKYNRESIETNYYGNYEEGIKILNISDKSINNNSLQLDFKINFTKNSSYKISAYLQYNGTVISSKTNKTISAGVNNIAMNFDNETVKNTHYSGKYNLTSIKINNKIIKTVYLTENYNYRDFAQSSYFSGFSEKGADADNNGLFDFLSLNTTLEIKNNGSYKVEAALYDLFGNFIEKQEKTWIFSPGKNNIALNFNGTNIYSKKLNGPYTIKYAKLAENNSISDEANGAYITANYDYASFEKPPLPDLNLSIEISDAHHYGISNVSLNLSVKNIGNKNAFSIFLEIFDNNTYSRNESINILSKGNYEKYSIDFSNASDFEFNAIADFDDFVEESNESNNIIKKTIKINKKPALNEIRNITVNETDLVSINAAAADPNGDNLDYSINSSRFSRDKNIFSWKTTTMDSGNHTIKINASDGYLYDYGIFKITVLDKREIDADDDGINDSLDKVIGMPEHINTSTINVSFFIGDSGNLSRMFNGTQKVEFKDKNATIVEFDFNFSSAAINLNNIVINKQSGNTTGAVVFTIRNMTLPEGFTKTIYLDKLNVSQNGICIKDMEVMAINEIGDGCNGENEHKIECDGTLQDGYNCTYSNATKKYKIAGLKNSGIKQIDFEKPQSSASTSSSGGAGGGGGNNAVCTEQWSCSEWPECVNDMQSRACNDLSQCGTNSNKPAEIRECPAPEKTEPKRQSLPKKAPNQDGTGEKTDGRMESFPKITGFLAANAEADPKVGISITLLIIALGISAFHTFRSHN